MQQANSQKNHYCVHPQLMGLFLGDLRGFLTQETDLKNGGLG
jgi:hypothetical protein